MVVVLDEERTPDRRSEGGLEGPRFRNPQLPGIETEPLLEREELVESRVVVRVGGDDQRAGTSVANLRAGGCSKVGREAWVPPGRFEIQFEEGLLAVMDLGDRGKHPGGGPRRTMAESLVDHRDAQAPFAGSPRDRQSDDAASDNHHIGGHATEYREREPLSRRPSRGPTREWTGLAHARAAQSTIHPSTRETSEA